MRAQAQVRAEAGRSASWAAILLPLLAVGGAIGCFADGLQANGTGHEPMLSYVLPLVISPVAAAALAVVAALVRRGRVYWLGFGYALVCASLIAGLIAARSGNSTL
jgi:cytochrome bd-type quinol oxidase subunit 2